MSDMEEDDISPPEWRYPPDVSESMPSAPNNIRPAMGQAGQPAHPTPRFLPPLPPDREMDLTIRKVEALSLMQGQNFISFSSRPQAAYQNSVRHLPLHLPVAPYYPVTNQEFCPVPILQHQELGFLPTVRCPSPLCSMPRLHPVLAADPPLRPHHSLKSQQAAYPVGPPTPPTENQIYPTMWRGYVVLKNHHVSVQMHYLFGNPNVAKHALPVNPDGSTPPLKIALRMKLEQTLLQDVVQKMLVQNQHCMLLALACGSNHADLLQQSNNLHFGLVTYLHQKQVAGIIKICDPRTQQDRYLLHIFPSCDFAIQHLARVVPDLLPQIIGIAHLLIIITAM